MDALTEALTTVRLTGAVYCTSDLFAPWGITFRARACAAFHVVDHGRCYLRIAGAEPLPLHGGDLVILPHGDEHTVASDPEGPSHVVDFRDDPHVCGPVAVRGRGESRTRLVCGEIHVEEASTHPLRAHLPRVMHVRGDGRTAEWLDITLRFLASEASEAAPGAQAILTRLIDILFVQAVRAWIAGDAEVTGWLAALRDPGLSAALTAVHRDPSHDWTVEKLGRAAGMSRTTFAARFTRVMGEPPLHYVLRWRMHHAASLIARDRTLSLAEVASRVGYDSEAAFHRAFRRVVGTTPGEHRRAAPAFTPPPLTARPVALAAE